jgi:hypothetical protein
MQRQRYSASSQHPANDRKVRKGSRTALQHGLEKVGFPLLTCPPLPRCRRSTAAGEQSRSDALVLTAQAACEFLRESLRGCGAARERLRSAVMDGQVKVSR